MRLTVFTQYNEEMLSGYKKAHLPPQTLNILRMTLKKQEIGLTQYLLSSSVQGS